MKAYRILTKRYYEEYSPVRSQIESFNYFIEYEMQKIIDEIGEIEITITPPGVKEVKIRFGKVSVGKPDVVEPDGIRRIIYPLETRIRNITYSSSVYLELEVYYDDNLREKSVVEIGRIPIMVKSKYCNLYGLSEEELIKIGEDPTDPGGYFIINGTERVLVMTEELFTNRLYVEKEKSGSAKYVGRIFSEAGILNVPHKIELMKDGLFMISFGKIKRTPVFVILKALGMETDQEIAQAIDPERLWDEVLLNLYEYQEIKNAEEAVKWLANHWHIPGPEELRKERVYEILDKYLLPHIGQTPADRYAKAWNLCKYIKKMLQVAYGELPEDDKDHYMNKQIRLAGDLLSEMFRVVFKLLINDAKYQYERLVKRGKIPIFRSVIRSKIFTERFETAMGTGQWTRNRVGVSQMLDRMNKLATISHLTRIWSPLEAEGEMYEIRMLHGTHWGRLCPIETPEGKNVGLRKNLALLARISPEVSEAEVLNKLRELGLEPYKK